MRERFKVWAPISVRWGDMDAYGHVNNAVYFTYFEAGRIEYFARVGLEEKSPTNLFAPALASATINFRKQLRFPAELETGLRATKIGNSSISLEHVLVRMGTEEVFADGTSVIVFVDYNVNKGTPLPDVVRQNIRTVEQNPAL